MCTAATGAQGILLVNAGTVQIFLLILAYILLPQGIEQGGSLGRRYQAIPFLYHDLYRR